MAGWPGGGYIETKGDREERRRRGKREGGKGVRGKGREGGREREREGGREGKGVEEGCLICHIRCKYCRIIEQ